MWVNHLSLANFRNYQSAELSLYPGANLLIGKNGQGKTNIAEAIAYFSSLSSHRVSQDSALIRVYADAAIARMQVTRGDRQVLLELQLNRESANKAQLNRAAVKPAALTEYFSCVLFAPEDLQIVRGEPAIRRRFLDEALSAQKPALRQLLADYDRVVKQRTTLLKSARALGLMKKQNSDETLSTLDVWNERLVKLGSKIIHEREKLLIALTDPLTKAYAELVEENHSPTLALSSTVTPSSSAEPGVVPRETSDIEEAFYRTLASVSSEEKERGVTLVGPHRDDFILGLNGLPVKGFASHGETWSFVLALRLATAQLIRRESNAGDPVLILDDVFAELDSRRRQRLFNALEDFEQVIVTAAVAEDVPINIDWHRTEIEAGHVLANGVPGESV